MTDEAPEQALGELAAAVTANAEDEQARAARAVAETRAHVLEQLRAEDGDPDLADRIEKGEPLGDGDKATVDAIIYGTGFLVDGERVSPTRVRLIRWEGP